MAKSILPAGVSDHPGERTSKRAMKTPSGTRALARLNIVGMQVVEEARLNGLLEGDKTEHVSFRAPPALLEAAKRETGIASTSELGILALAMLAQPDPVVAIMKRNRGRLGKDHKLDY